MSDSIKRKILSGVVAACLLLSLIVLIAGIEEMEFKEGYSLNLFQFTLTQPLIGLPDQPLILKPLLGVVVVMVVFLLITLALLPRLWLRILKTTIRVVSFYILFYLLITHLHFQWMQAALSAPEVGADQDSSKSASAIFDALRFEASDSVVYLTSFMLVLGGMTGMVFLWRKIRKDTISSPLEAFSNQAEQALAQVQSGENLRNTIIRCYAEMSEALQAHHQIKRDDMMTPREFEIRLLQYELPQEPISKLTDLFEQVRYGRKEMGEEEEKQCIASLSAIIQACREKNDNIPQP